MGTEPGSFDERIEQLKLEVEKAKLQEAAALTWLTCYRQAIVIVFGSTEQMKPLLEMVERTAAALAARGV